MIYKDWKKSFIFVKWILTMMIVVNSTQIFLHQFSDKASRRDKNINSVIYWIDEKKSISSVIYWIDEKKTSIQWYTELTKKEASVQWYTELTKKEASIQWYIELTKKKHQFNDILNWRKKNIDIDDINEKRTLTLNKNDYYTSFKTQDFNFNNLNNIKKKRIIFRRM
jgi:hypothetical protein